ncbi:MAG: nicotinate-nucleotide adenylyltransferase, partial [Anaerotignum sp.]|nr:nicotinate-nucleotide adenylyltransferase [Anaerotignum sp.]
MRNEIANFRDCQSIAIMGGTFDPIHNGHLVTAEAVRHRFKVDRVVFMPAGQPAHKANKKVTHNEHRYLMTVLATMRNENFEVSRIEIDRPGATYTIDTIEELKKICRPDVRLYFITGADAIHQIMTWKQPERLLTLCDFVAVTRPGYDRAKLFEDIGEIREKYASRIHYMEVPALAISSSDIRDRAQKGEPIKYLLPQEVEDYIHKFGLYQDDTTEEVKFMLPISTMQEKLQSAISVKRYIHTMGVAEEAVKLAEIYGTAQDQQKARVAGLLHDCAKDYPENMRLRFCKEYKVKTDDIMNKQTDLIHPFLGAEVAKREYQVMDEDVLNAIRYHTTGRPNMSLLEKIVFIA